MINQKNVIAIKKPNAFTNFELPFSLFMSQFVMLEIGVKSIIEKVNNINPV